MRVLKWIGLALGGLLLLILLAVLVIRFLIDPNDFKGQISALVKDASGYELGLEGDLGWSFYPVLGFESSNVTLAAQLNKPFLTIQNLAIGIQVMPLFSGQLNVDQLQVDGVDVQLLVDAGGSNNWTVESASTVTAKAKEQEQTASSSAGAATEPAAELPEISIPLVRILNANVRYQDQQAKSDTSVAIKRLELRNVQLQEPVEILLELALAQADGPSVDLVLNGAVQPDLEKQIFKVAPLQAQATIHNALAKPLAVNLDSQVLVDLGADRAELSVTQLKLADAVVSGAISVAALTAEPRFEGNLSSKPISLPRLMSVLALELPEPSNPDVMKTASFQLAFNGDTQQLKVPSLLMQLDQSKVNGTLAVNDFSTQAISFDLALDQINVDDYLPKPAEETTSSPAAGAGTQTNEESALIPVEALRPLNLNGRFKAGQVTLEQTLIENMVLAVTARDGVLTVKELKADLLEGSLDGQLSLDARTDTPTMTSDIKVNGIELTQISSRFMTDSLLSGKASFAMDANAKGNTVDELLKSALGQMNLKLDDGVLHGINLNAIVVDALKSQLATVEYLYPNYQEKLPRQLREDTEISKLLADAKVENGHLIMPNFEFFTGDSGIDASGKIDLLNQGFDYDFGVVLSALERNKYLKGTRWPIRCQGALASSPADWCGPDTKAMGAILKKAAGNALKDKSAAELGEKIGLEAEDQAELKDEVKQKLEAEEDRAKKKLQEKLNKWLSK
ncbi:MAG: AsmA family protein [Ketobacter sp.]|nr:MAG: AsmA family protein [Ketobacter sp.]